MEDWQKDGNGNKYLIYCAMVYFVYVEKKFK